MNNTTQQSPYIVHDFYKVYTQKTNFLNQLTPAVTDPEYLKHLLQSSASQSKIRRFLEHNKKLLPIIDNDQLIFNFHQNLSSCEDILHRDRQQFNDTVEQIYGRCYNLRQIGRLTLKADRIAEKYSVQLKNLKNLRRSITAENINTFLSQHCDDMLEQLPSSTSVASSSMKSKSDSAKSDQSLTVPDDNLDHRVQAKIDHAQQIITEVSSTQLRELEASMFTSSDSLNTRKMLGQQKLNAKRQSIRSHMHSIAELEKNIADMHLQMNVISVAVMQAREMLAKRMQSMDMSVEELVRMQHMLISIYGDIVDRVHGFSDKLSEFDVNGNGASSKQIRDLKMAHLQAIDLLKNESLVGTIRNNLEYLEQSKIGKSPSQVILIDAQIRKILLDGIAEQEQSKIGKSPSEIMLVDEQIRAIKHILATNDASDMGPVEKEKDNLGQSNFRKSSSQMRLIALQRSKIGKSPSELLAIEAQIRQNLVDQLAWQESSKVGKSPSEVKLINEQIDIIKNMMEDNATSGDGKFIREITGFVCSDMTLHLTTAAAEAALGKITSALDVFAKSVSSSITTQEDILPFDQKGLYPK